LIDYIFRYKNLNHTDKKSQILEAIASSPQISTAGGQRSKNASTTDFFIQGLDRPYVNIIFNDIELFLKEATSFFLNDFHTSVSASVSASDFWFQQYDTGSTHRFHVHRSTMFACVYFVELDSPNTSTQFMHRSGLVYNVAVEEGDIIAFPSCLLHCSPVNLGNRKSVIAFNINFDIINFTNQADTSGSSL